MKQEKMKGIRFDNDLLRKIEQFAKKEGRTFSGMVKHILVMFFKNHISRRES